MRKTALLALTLLALTPITTQASILQLSFDSSVALTDDPENLFGYEALSGQQAQIKILIDLDKLPARQIVPYRDDYNHVQYLSLDPQQNWLRMSAQIGDRVLESAVGTEAPQIRRAFTFVNLPGPNTLVVKVFPLGELGMPVQANLLIDTSALPDPLWQMQVSAPFSFMADSPLLQFYHYVDSCSSPRGAPYASCQMRDAYAVATIHIMGGKTVINAELLPSPTEVPLPASAWLFGSALLGLGARRTWQANHA